MGDAMVRRAFEAGSGAPRTPMSVWLDSDQSWFHTQLGPSHLPNWETLTEAMKMFVGFDVGMELGTAYTFSAHIEPALIARWPQSPQGLMSNVEQRLRRALREQGLGDLPFCYIVETRTRSGRSSTRPHLHGYLIADDPVSTTNFKVALERALHPDLKKRGRSRATKIARAFDLGQEFTGRGRWVSYMIKNIDRWDARLGKRRVFISRSLIDIARLAWKARRSE